MTEVEQKQILEEWLSKYKGMLFKIVRAYAADPMDRDDLFQEITIQVWHSIPSFRQESAVTTWMYRVALNTAIKWTRKVRKYQPLEDLERAQHILKESEDHSDEQLAWLYEEIHKLDEIDRSICLLMLDGFGYKEMSVMLGITESNVGVKINRIKKLLSSKSKTNYHYGI